jgi:hypothetical protein
MTSTWQTALCMIALTTLAGGGLIAQAPAAAHGKQALEKLKALEGDWIDVEGVFAAKGAVAVTYRVTSGGNAVVETFPVNTPNEMVTVYHLDGGNLVMTHFCSSGNQPRMRSSGLQDNMLSFDFDGGTNIDPATTSHMHSAKIEFVSSDEIRGTWQNWSMGKPDHSAKFHVVRRR